MLSEVVRVHMQVKCVVRAISKPPYTTATKKILSKKDKAVSALLVPTALKKL